MRRVAGFWPFLPASVLSPNRGERRGGRVPQDISEAKRQMRSDTCLWLLAQDDVRAITEPFQYARLSCVYYSTTPRTDGFYRAADATNAIYAHKAFYDGFKDAGLIVDDDWMHLELGIQLVRTVKDASHEGVQFILEEVEFEPDEASAAASLAQKDNE